MDPIQFNSTESNLYSGKMLVLLSNVVTVYCRQLAAVAVGIPGCVGSSLGRTRLVFTTASWHLHCVFGWLTTLQLATPVNGAGTVLTTITVHTVIFSAVLIIPTLPVTVTGPGHHILNLTAFTH
jgi:hypothetical protein